jgi:hypothetical protein
MKDISTLKVVELQQELKKLGLPYAGKKSELLERLTEAMATGGAAASEAPAQEETPSEAVPEKVPVPAPSSASAVDALLSDVLVESATAKQVKVPATKQVKAATAATAKPQVKAAAAPNAKPAAPVAAAATTPKVGSKHTTPAATWDHWHALPAKSRLASLEQTPGKGKSSKVKLETAPAVVRALQGAVSVQYDVTPVGTLFQATCSATVLAKSWHQESVQGEAGKDKKQAEDAAAKAMLAVLTEKFAEETEEDKVIFQAATAKAALVHEMRAKAAAAREAAAVPKATTPKAAAPKATNPKAAAPKATTPKAGTPKAAAPAAVVVTASG